MTISTQTLSKTCGIKAVKQGQVGWDHFLAVCFLWFCNMCCAYLKILLLASVAARGLGELFTSIAHLQTALYAERDIAEEIRDYVKREEEKLNNLKRCSIFFCFFNMYP